MHSAFCIALVSCAPKAPITLPSDPGTPFPDFAAVHAKLSTACAGVRDLQMEMRLSGSVGDEKLRGTTVHAGFERPTSMRLEGVPPIGGPVFILAARDGSATLLMTRSKEILRDAPPEAVLEAMTGVALAPTDLLSVLTGCVLPEPKPISGTLHAGNRAAIEIETASQPGAARTATLYLRRVGGEWQLEVARRDRWQVEYTYGTGQFPESVRLISMAPRVNLRAALSQIEPNTGIDPAAFAVIEPKDVTTFTIEDLRRAGPLRDQ